MWPYCGGNLSQLLITSGHLCYAQIQLGLLPCSRRHGAACDLDVSLALVPSCVQDLALPGSPTARYYLQAGD